MNPSIIQEAKREELTFGGMRVMETKKDFTFFVTSTVRSNDHGWKEENLI